MTPLHIKLLLHFHCHPVPWPHQDAPAVIAYVQELEAEGLITKPDGGVYTTTERGSAHVTQLCNLALPTLQWIGADGKLITEHP